MSQKDITENPKSRGLQRLKWYCQMCKKQCRDDNGFKCHLMSEAHQRQMVIFSENPEYFIESFSQEFLDGFIHILKHNYNTKRANANYVYQDYIRDKNHIHMNSTKWVTLTDFVKWLGSNGYCTVEETSKEWFITYIERDAEVIKRQEALKSRHKAEKDDQERMHEFLQKQIERNQHNRKQKVRDPVEYKKTGEKVKVNISTGDISKSKIPVPQKESALEFLNEKKEQKLDKNLSENNIKKTSNLEKLIKEEFVGKRKRKDNWIVPDVQDKYTAFINLIDSSVGEGTKIKLDQLHLETVIPTIGRTVKIVNGEYRDECGKLINVDFENCTAKPLFKGKIVEGLQFDDICKYVDT